MLATEKTSSQNNAKILSQMDAWGITAEEITAELTQYTNNIVTAPSKRVGDIVVQFGFATRQEVERFVSTKPTNVLMLDHLSEHIDNLRPHTQKLLAANDRLAYYETLTNAPVHADLQNNTALRLFCQEHNCIPLTCKTDDSLRLIFADYAAQKDYAQRSRIARATDPITALQTTYGYERIIFAIGHREHIATRLHSDTTENVQATDDEDKVNIWSDNNASTANQKLLARILTLSVEKKATNIKFTPNHNGTVDIFYRRHGNLRKIPGIRTISSVQAEEINRFLHIKSIARHTDTAKRVEGRLQSPADGQFVFRTSTSETFMRCSYIPAANDGLSHLLESISIRLLPRNSVSIKLNDINVSDEIITIIQEYLLQSHGLILVVGPTSSGKSTTIAGMISLYLDLFKDSRNLLSLEQPVERHLHGITQINVHQNKFESGMAALLRHDPDFIWVGELRDRPSASTCIRAANTGHIVVSTLHADDTAGAYNALLSYISNQTGSSADSVIVTQHDAITALSLIIAQRLIPTLCPHCKQTAAQVGVDIYESYLKKYIGYCQRNGYTPKDISKSYFLNPQGCEKCEHEGYAGEIPINEFLPITRDLRKQLVKMANVGQNDLEILSKQRTFSLFDEAIKLVVEGKIVGDTRQFVAINDAFL